MRAQRDIVRLPLRYFPSPEDARKSRRAALLPDREPYIMLRGTPAADDENVVVCDGARVLLPPGIRRVAVDLPSRAGSTTRAAECVVFASYSESPGGVLLRKPEDPMAEQVLLPGTLTSWHMRARGPRSGTRSFQAFSSP